MKTKDFTTTILVDQTPQQVFDAVTNIRGWWSEEVEGRTDKLNEEFRYHFQDVHRSRLKVTELIPGQKVVWEVLDNYFSFTKDSSEWTGNNLIFEMEEKEGKTQLRFTHQGLVPAYECYDICTGAWDQYIGQSLRDLITTGKGQPNGTGKPQTDDEEKLGSGN